LASTGALDLGTSTVGGNLAANSGNGSVTQDGPLAVGGTTGIVAGTGNITLANARNTLAQAVSASGAVISLADAGPLTLGTIDATANFTLVSNGALDLGTSTVGGNLAANSNNGDVTQGGPLVVAGTTGIVAGTGTIQLNNPGNTFDGTLTTTGAGVSIVDQQTELSASQSLATAVAQLESAIFESAMATQPGQMNPESPSFNAVPVTGSTASATADTLSPPDSGDDGLATVTLTIGVNGPGLKIVHGGVRLPNDTLSVSE